MQFQITTLSENCAAVGARGLLGEWSSEAGDLAIFGGITLFTIVFGGAVLLFLKPLNQLTHGAEADDHTVDEVDDVVVIAQASAAAAVVADVNKAAVFEECKVLVVGDVEDKAADDNMVDELLDKLLELWEPFN